MHARLRLDLGWGDLFHGAAKLALARDAGAWARRVEARFGDGAFATLSARTGFDLYLAALALPRGSEVLVSALTIPHMPRILEAHGLVVVPFELDPASLAPARGELERRASERTRAVLFAHLFGQRADLRPTLALAQARGWRVWEDCAQAYTGDSWQGHAESDLALFSFGLIKNCSAVQGGILRVPDGELRERMAAAQAGRPRQPRADYARRLGKAAALKTLSSPRLFALFARRLAQRRRDIDQVLHAVSRGFPGPDYLQRLRHAPSAPLLALLERRLARRGRPGSSIAPDKRVVGEWLLAELPAETELYGRAASERTHWVFALGVDEPRQLVRALRAVGFDATAHSSLEPVRPTAGGPAPAGARRLLERAVFVPLVPGLDARRRAELVGVLRSATRVVELGPAREPAAEPRPGPALGLPFGEPRSHAGKAPQGPGG